MEKLTKLLEEICPGIDPSNKALVDEGVIDSFDMVAIVSSIIDTFKIEISVEDIIPENFNSVEAMMKLIERRS
jgi:acyl carrier protein